MSLEWTLCFGRNLFRRESLIISIALGSAAYCTTLSVVTEWKKNLFCYRVDKGREIWGRTNIWKIPLHCATFPNCIFPDSRNEMRSRRRRRISGKCCRGRRKTVPSYPTVQPPGNALRASKVSAFPSGFGTTTSIPAIFSECLKVCERLGRRGHVARFTPPMFQSFPWKVSSNMGPAFFPPKRSRTRKGSFHWSAAFASEFRLNFDWDVIRL